MITSSHQYVWLLYESQLTITTRLSNHYQRVFIVSWLSSKEDLWQRHQCKIRLQSNGDTSFSISKNNVFFLKDKSVERGVVFLFLGVLDHLEIEKNKQKNLNIWSEIETLKHCTELSFTIELFSFCYYRLLQINDLSFFCVYWWSLKFLLCLNSRSIWTLFSWLWVSHSWQCCMKLIIKKTTDFLFYSISFYEVPTFYKRIITAYLAVGNNSSNMHKHSFWVASAFAFCFFVHSNPGRSWVCEGR